MIAGEDLNLLLMGAIIGCFGNIDSRSSSSLIIERLESLTTDVCCL
jgi:hypothetical protein